MTLTLSEIRHKLVVACQAEYDRRIVNGVHPYAIASYHFNNVVSNELEKYVDTSDWKAGNWRELNRAYAEKDNSNPEGQWAVTACLRQTEAWATPGFAEAYQYHSLHGE